MRAKNSQLLWGVVLILVGILYLARSMGYLVDLGPFIWSGVFAAAALLFLVAYFMNGLQHWGWLFPASISAGIALTIYLSETAASEAAIGAPVLISIAIPFAVAYFLDPRRRWWALIPAWVMTVLTVIVFFSDRVSGEMIGSLFMFAIALPFMAVFLANRTHRWALIPAFAMSVIAVIPVLATRVSGEAIGTYVTLMIAAPFLVVYFWSPKNWWALIPGGVMGTIALGLLFFLPGAAEVAHPEWMAAFMFLGWALTFGVLWLRRKDQPTAWAGYIALGFGLSGLVALLVGDRFDTFWPIVIIAVGIVVLFGSLRRRPAA